MDTKANPYAAVESTPSMPPEVEGRPSVGRCVLTGTMWAIFSTIPIAGLTALVFRFPVPFAGYLSGFDAVIPAMFAVAFYGVLCGGFLVLGLLGAAGGALIGVGVDLDKRATYRLVRLQSFVFATIGVFVLAILDKIIGPF